MRHGTLHVGRRLEYGFAQLAMLINNAHFKEKRQMNDFMPHYKPEPEREITLDEAMKEWQ